MSDRQNTMSSAYAEATKRLRLNHIDEFHVILDAIYVERGMEIKKRLRGQRLLDKKIAEAKALLAQAEGVTTSE